MQTNVLIQYPCRLFSQKIPTKSATVGVLSTRLTELIRASKNKDGRYGNLIKIISSVDTLTLAYLSIKKNSGNMTKGLDNETLDGIDKDFFKKISKQILEGSYKFSPVRRVEIPKPGKSGLRPLGVSSPRQKIVQKAMEMVFSLIFEDIFLDCSHGFRPGRSCHTALHHLQLKAGNVSTFSWVIEGDIKGCFDNIPHSQIIKGINRRIDCPATTNLVKTLLSAGYVVDHKTKTPKKKLPVVKSVVGTPQGTVLSPLFCNIVLHELDYFIMNILSSDFEMGKRRRTNPAYSKVSNAIKNAKTPKQKRKLANIRLRTPSIDPMDKNFKRIHYVRYADDWVIFVCGSYNDANLIKNSVSKKLKNLGLALNLDKSVITHLRKQRGKFLGFEFFIRKTSKDLIKPVKAIKYGNTSIRKRFSPRLILHAPIKDLLIKLVKLGFAKRNHLGQFHYKGKASTVPLTHPQILQFYNSKVRNLLNYYSCAHNRMCLWSLVRFMKFSCALSLARKFKLKSMAKTFKKFGSSLKYVSDKGKEHHFFIPKNLRILPMKERFNSKISFHSVDSLLKSTWYKSMTNSQLDEACVICGTTDNIEIHHLRSVKNVRIRTNTFAQWKGGFLRKSIPLCSAHHLAYHNGQLTKDEISIIAKYRGK
jgi:group II intron reverse transcriptase/maturase